MSSTSSDVQMISLTSDQLSAIVQNAITGALATAQNTASANHRHQRPSVDLDCTENKWAFFANEWKLYKAKAHLPDDSPAELRACCTEALRITLFEFLGTTIDNLNEKDLLSKIHQLAVKGKNTAVHR